MRISGADSGAKRGPSTPAPWPALALRGSSQATSAGNGILARIVTGSYGQSPNSYGISAYIANSCDGTGTPIGVAATYKYNMAP